ncbi:ABC transporter permease [Arsukibacterium sp.]|uniref:ABC transporter permease n=1 Tax=Arsukibacterium sp. TaxID=1977258 RepID=UPI001BD2F46B|nr:ABC transporter permease [Arsukibacterium sp.]
MQLRSPWQVALHVWHALFMREATARISGDRFGWTWLLLEPIAHLVILISLRQLMGRIKMIPGADFIPWLIVGIVGFLMFRNAMNRSMNAIAANRALFAYRQVHPFDTVLIRAVLEGVLKSIVFMLMIFGASFLGHEIMPANAIQAGWVWLNLWLLGFAFGLLFSVAITLVQELAKIIGMITFPLYFLSGVIIPIQLKPHYLREYLLYNPVLHGLESLRLAFFEHYRTIDGINLLYLQYWSISILLLSLMLHIRLKTRLMAQ